MSFYTVVSSGLIFSWSHEVIVTKQKYKNRTIYGFLHCKIPDKMFRKLMLLQQVYSRADNGRQCDGGRLVFSEIRKSGHRGGKSYRN